MDFFSKFSKSEAANTDSENPEMISSVKFSNNRENDPTDYKPSDEKTAVDYVTDASAGEYGEETPEDFSEKPSTDETTAEDTADGFAAKAARGGYGEDTEVGFGELNPSEDGIFNPEPAVADEEPGTEYGASADPEFEYTKNVGEDFSEEPSSGGAAGGADFGEETAYKGGESYSNIGDDKY